MAHACRSFNYQKGIYRAPIQTGPAALSSAKSPYDDEILADGFLYAYRSGSADQPDNRALRTAHDLQVPPVYFIGTRPGWYKPVFPCFVTGNDHQARFRARVVPAYSSQCAICRLKELRLLDAAHIVGDVEDLGEPSITNGLSLCAIHHRAFDHNLVGVSPDHLVHVSRRLLEDEDGAMLDLLKGFHEQPLSLPTRPSDRPDRERLDARFARFRRLTA